MSEQQRGCWPLPLTSVLALLTQLACISPTTKANIESTYFQAVAAGLSTTCIRDATHLAVCYGLSVGDGASAFSPHMTPFIPNGPEPASTPHGLGPVGALAASASGSNAVRASREDGSATVVCWGFQTLVGSSNLAKTVVVVAYVAGVTNLGVGGQRACAVLGDGSVTCWGLDGTQTTPQKLLPWFLVFRRSPTSP